MTWIFLLESFILWNVWAHLFSQHSLSRLPENASKQRLRDRKMAERARAARKSHTSTADLLTWTVTPPPSPSPPSASRSHQVSIFLF